MCSPGVAGILVKDVCCPLSCGSCAGADTDEGRVFNRAHSQVYQSSSRVEGVVALRHGFNTFLHNLTPAVLRLQVSVAVQERVARISLAAKPAAEGE